RTTGLPRKSERLTRSPASVVAVKSGAGSPSVTICAAYWPSPCQRLEGQAPNWATLVATWPTVSSWATARIHRGGRYETGTCGRHWCGGFHGRRSDRCSGG